MSLLVARLLEAAFGLALIAGGLALTANFRGVTEWHIRKTYESLEELDRVPLWRRLSCRRPLEQQIARNVILERVVGAIFAALGVLVLIVFIVAHLRERS
jgi:hypothetical protein